MALKFARFITYTGDAQLIQQAKTMAEFGGNAKFMGHLEPISIENEIEAWNLLSQTA